MAKRPNHTATTSNGGIPPVADTATAGEASSVAGAASLAGAAEDTRDGFATEGAGGLGPTPVVNGPATPSHEQEVSAAANSAFLDGRPEDVARATEAVAGSALNAPSVGSGPVSDPLLSDIDTVVHGDRIVLTDLAREPGGVVAGGRAFEVGTAAGLPPAIMSREGALGSAPEAGGISLASRLDAIEGGPSLRSAGYKRAEPLPKDRTNVPELIEQGFDLIVTAKQEGFRRAGVAHPSSPTLRRSEDFTPAELQAMDADPMLVVQALR